MIESPRPKIGVLDIETAPIIGNVWGLYDQNVGINQIEKEWAILSFAFVDLEGTKKDVIYMDNSDNEDPRDDYVLCDALWQLLDEYDFIIAQNGKRFDKKKIYARLIELGFPPPSPCEVIDTMLMARQVAAFTSNKLEWLSVHLTDIPKSTHKKFPGFELWAECLKGNPKAWKEMKRYNIPDILACRALYLRLRPWVTTHPNLNVYNDENDTACPRCCSTDLSERGYSYTSVGKYRRYVCNGCGGWTRSRFTLNTTTKRKTLLK